MICLWSKGYKLTCEVWWRHSWGVFTWLLPVQDHLSLLLMYLVLLALEYYRHILPANLKRNASKVIGWKFILQQDSNPKYTATTTEECIRRKQFTLLDWPNQSLDRNPIEHTFLLFKRRMNEGTSQNQQDLKKAMLELCKSITNEVYNKWWR